MFKKLVLFCFAAISSYAFLTYADTANILNVKVFTPTPFKVYLAEAQPLLQTGASWINNPSCTSSYCTFEIKLNPVPVCLNPIKPDSGNYPVSLLIGPQDESDICAVTVTYNVRLNRVTNTNIECSNSQYIYSGGVLRNDLGALILNISANPKGNGFSGQ